MTTLISGKRYQEMRDRGWHFRRVEIGRDTVDEVVAQITKMGYETKVYRKTTGIRGFYHVLVAYRRRG